MSSEMTQPCHSRISIITSSKPSLVLPAFFRGCKGSHVYGAEWVKHYYEVHLQDISNIILNLTKQFGTHTHWHLQQSPTWCSAKAFATSKDFRWFRCFRAYCIHLLKQADYNHIER